MENENAPTGAGNSDASDTRRYRRLNRVEQLHRNLPFDASAGNLYEEHQKPDERIRYDTRTFRYVESLLQRSERAFIVFTGNAGHGKTHICRRLVQPGNAGAMEQMSEDVEGEYDWRVENSSKPLRIVKDLSELSPEDGQRRLEALIAQQDAHVVVCANEGRLRDVAGRSEVLGCLLEALSLGLERGATHSPGDDLVHVINLNYQTATAGEGGFFDHVLSEYLNYEQAWSVCNQCAAHDRCPIRKNRDALAISTQTPPENEARRRALVELVRIVEESGYVLTYREVLVLVSYLVTGALDCEGVEARHRGQNRDPLERYGLLQSLFDRELGPDERSVLPVIDRIRRLDPGRVALRPVDEAIHSDLERERKLGAGLFGGENRQLTTRRELREETREHRELVREYRRIHWFERVEDGLSRPRRLGLEFYEDFRAARDRETEDKERIKIIRSLVRGLHTVQGAVGAGARGHLHIVDPAFGRSGSHAAIVARSVEIRHLEIRGESAWWSHLSGDDADGPSMPDSVEWTDRHVVLSHEPPNVEPSEHVALLRLDLVTFEFLVAAGRGIVMREFHSAERRRILRKLARYAEAGEKRSTEIRVLHGDSHARLIIERDDTIHFGDN